jgi:restriction endonuclease S subunit
MRENWKILKLGQFAEQSKEKIKLEKDIEYLIIGVMMEGRGFVSREPFLGGKTTYKVLTPVHENQLILRSITAWEAPIQVSREEHEGYHVSGVFPVFNLNLTIIFPKFLSLICRYEPFWESMRERTVGSVLRRKTLSASALLDIEVNLPPLQEQKRIVDFILSIDSYIDALQYQADSARKSRSAVLHEMLSAGGDDWTETTLGEVAEVIDPHPSHRAPPVDEEGIPFVGIGDLRNPRDIDFNKARKVSKQVLIEHMARYSRSDYLIGLGRVASIGMVVLLPGEHVDYAVSPTLAVIKPTGVMNEFLFYLLEGPQAQGQFQTMKKGSTRESVGMQVLRKIRVLVPPLQEQKRIVDLISLMDKAISATERAVTESKNLRSGLLSDLLSGDHEIPSSYDSVMGAA